MSLNFTVIFSPPLLPSLHVSISVFVIDVSMEEFVSAIKLCIFENDRA